MHRHRTELVHKAKRTIGQVRNEINVTPLVDVCLVLLIIFMVVTDKLARGKDVPLPKTRYHKTENDTGESLIISVTKDAAKTTIWWDRDALQNIDEFKKRLEDELRRKPRPMYVKADADLKYKDVFPVLVEMSHAGAHGVQIGTQELKENK